MYVFNEFCKSIGVTVIDRTCNSMYVLSIVVSIFAFSLKCLTMEGMKINVKNSNKLCLEYEPHTFCQNFFFRWGLLI